MTEKRIGLENLNASLDQIDKVFADCRYQAAAWQAQLAETTAGQEKIEAERASGHRPRRPHLRLVETDVPEE